MQMWGAKKFCPFSAEDYQQAITAKGILKGAIDISQKCRMMLENFVDYEGRLLSLTNRTLVIGHRDWHSSQDDIYEVTRWLVNLLTTARLYLDQVEHDLSALFGKESAQFRRMNEATKSQYDERLGYRTMYSLRNFIQHRALPIYGLKFVNRRINTPAGDQFISTCTPQLDTESLKIQGNFKPAVLRELSAHAEPDGTIDLKPLVREFVTGLTVVHREVLNSIQPQVEQSKIVHSKIFSQFRDSFGSDSSGLALVRREAGGLRIDANLVEELPGRLDYLSIFTRSFKHFSVTSQDESALPEYKF